MSVIGDYSVSDTYGAVYWHIHQTLNKIKILFNVVGQNQAISISSFRALKESKDSLEPPAVNVIHGILIHGIPSQARDDEIWF